jgi:hypothetical protein
VTDSPRSNSFGWKVAVLFFGLAVTAVVFVSTSPVSRSDVTSHGGSALEDFKGDTKRLYPAYTEASGPRDKWVAEMRAPHLAEIEAAENGLAKVEELRTQADNEYNTAHKSAETEAARLNQARDERRAEYLTNINGSARDPQRELNEWFADAGTRVVTLLKKICTDQRISYAVLADTEDPTAILAFLTEEQAGAPENSALAKPAVIVRTNYFTHLRPQIKLYPAWKDIELTLMEIGGRLQAARTALQETQRELASKMGAWDRENPYALVKAPKPPDRYGTELFTAQSELSLVNSKYSASALRMKYRETAEGQKLYNIEQQIEKINQTELATRKAAEAAEAARLAPKPAENVATEQRLYSDNGSAPKVRPSNAPWFKGGTLHRATVREWNRATEEDKLATCSDWVVGWENAGLSKRKYPSMDEVRADAVELRIAINLTLQAIGDSEPIGPYVALIGMQLGIVRRE